MSEPVVVAKSAGVRGFRYYGASKGPVSAWVDEEWLTQLSGTAGVRVYREMLDNDAVIGAGRNLTQSAVRQVPWHAQPADNTPAAKMEADFLTSVVEDMDHTWDEFMSEVLSFLYFGWAFHEVTTKVRRGGAGSAFDDGRIGLKEVAIRAQETLDDWKIDENGNVLGMYQRAAPRWERVFIPMEKAVLFRTESNKGSPEGRSLLRNAYRSWYFLKRLQELEAIGIERDLVGLPVIELPAAYMERGAPDDKKAALESYKQLLQQIRRNEHEGVIFPAEMHPDGRPTGFKIRLLTSGGARQATPGEPIRRYEQRIAMIFNTGFQFLGMGEGSGSYGLSTDLTDLYVLSLRAILDNVEDTFNKYVVRPLFKLNGVPLERTPRFVHGEVRRQNVAAFADAMLKLVDARVITPSPDLEDFARQQLGLPQRAPGDRVSPLPVPGATDEHLVAREEMREQARAGALTTGPVTPTVP